MTCWDIEQKGFCPRSGADDGKGGGKGWGGGGNSWNGGGGKGWGGGKSWGNGGSSKGWNGGGKGWGGGGGSPGVWNQTLKWNMGKGKGKNDRKPIDPSKTIWIGNLPEETSYQELKSHAEAAGVMALWAQTYKGKGAGTGAVGFKTMEEAQQATMILNGSIFKNVAIIADSWEKQRKW
ncbi:Ttc28 [Symbiodinium pilosum]|uniref:Ttc28 protein n=1 Tax=Symbiodinium pilosum TaxID=2952 RepID=A0A812KNV4_SYMPI|nr:Ttc28 [Symbiodinium pilosum]